jgi:branched-chain amino acid transport system ATP-binding protein
MLKIEAVHAAYGNIRALRGISLTVERGEIVTMIGANGAGKTTTLKTILGLLRPREGRILFEEERIDGLPPHQVVQRGIASSPEGRRIFSRMTVMENLELGAFARTDAANIRRDMEWVFSLFPRLRERLGQTGGTLSGGEQQMLAIGRALMARPRVLLLDEPSMGLAPILVQSIFSIIRDINREGTAILVVEQNARMALSVAHRGYVIQTGQIVLEGSAPDLMINEEVRKAYLGTQMVERVERR